MRLVLKAARMAAHHSEDGRRCARAVAELVQDGHFLTIIHGQGPGVQPCAGANTNGNRHHWDHGEDWELAAVEHENRALVSLLAQAKVIGIGLHATDAGLIQLRKQHSRTGKPGIRVEAAHLHSRWLEIICCNKGVPVLSNLSCWPGEKRHLIDPDWMAAVCAADWNADALIYLTEENGVLGAEGRVLRWLDIGSNGGSQAAMLNDEMRARLEACAMALKHGVRRVRILPTSNVDCLPSFYFSSIEYGTEVISGSAWIEESPAATLDGY